jgi:hypothetical protein
MSSLPHATDTVELTIDAFAVVKLQDGRIHPGPLDSGPGSFLSTVRGAS